MQPEQRQASLTAGGKGGRNKITIDSHLRIVYHKHVGDELRHHRNCISPTTPPATAATCCMGGVLIERRREPNG